MSQSKLMTAKEAIDKFVMDGDIVYTGYNLIPHALCHEIIRQKKKNLTVAGASVPEMDALLYITGCSNRAITGYIGGAVGGTLVGELMEKGELQFEDYSNQGLTMMFLAGALGIPFIPTRAFLGTDFLTEKCINHPGGWLREKKYQPSECPFSGEKVVLLPALNPDVSIMAAQRADEEGNVQAWGALGDAKWALWASKKNIVSVEEIVSSEVIRSDPNRTILPSFKVNAVVHEPFGAHPWPVTGYYDMDFVFREVTLDIYRDREACNSFLDEWVYGVKNRSEYIEHYVERFGYTALKNITAQPPIQPVGTISYAYVPHIQI